MSEEDQKKFWDSHTSLKIHESPDAIDEMLSHSQSKRKHKLETAYKVACPDQTDVFLVYGQNHKKNKFKLNKLRQRGDTTLTGRPRKVKEAKEVICEKCEEPVVNTEVVA